MQNQPLLYAINSIINLTEQEEVLLISKIKKRKYLRNQYLVQQGDVCNTVSLVISGCLKTFYVDNQGNEHVVLFAIEDWWSADLGSFITQTPADFNVQCIEDTILFQFTYEDLNYLYVEIPKLERFFRVLVEKALVSTQKRIIRNFSLTAKERYLKFREIYPKMDQRVPQYLIASYLGITKEFLSKIKSQLILEQ